MEKNEVNKFENQEGLKEFYVKKVEKLSVNMEIFKDISFMTLGADAASLTASCVEPRLLKVAFILAVITAFCGYKSLHYIKEKESIEKILNTINVLEDNGNQKEPECDEKEANMTHKR